MDRLSQDKPWKKSSQLLEMLGGVILSKFPKLVPRTESDSNGNDYFRIDHQVIQPCTVKYVSEFLVVAEAAAGDQVIDVKLLTYAGKTLRTEHLNLGNLDVSSAVLSAWNGNEIRLCHGVSENKVSNNIIEEHFGDKLVKRARTCNYELIGQANRTQCESCMQVDSDSDIGPGEVLSDLKTEVQVKGEPEDHEDQSWAVWDGEEGEFPDPEVYIDEKDDFEEPVAKKKRIIPKKRLSSSSSDSSEEENEDDEYVPHKKTSLKKKEPKDINATELSKKKGRGRPRKHIELYSEDEDGNVIKKKRVNFPCSNCKEIFKSRFLSKKHETYCVQGLTGPEATIKECPVCLKQYRLQKKLETHLAFHEERSELNKAVECPRCGLRLETKYKLNPHYQETHGKDVGCCVECLKEIDVPDLWKHVYGHFLRLKKHLCTTCGESLASMAALKDHYAWAHEDHANNMVICDECGKLIHKTKMIKHKSSNHPKAKLFLCNVCGKEFRTSNLYFKHIKIHSSSKPWACDICNYRSVRRDNVRLHVRKCHSILDDPKDHVVKIGEHVYDPRLKQAKKAKLHIVKLDKPRPGQTEVENSSEHNIAL